MEEPKGDVLQLNRVSDHKCTVDMCCCGCSLKTGSMIIAILSLFLNGINIASAFYLNGTRELIGLIQLLSVILAILHFIVSILLLNGIRQGKHNFAKVWVWVGIVAIIFSLIIAVINLVSFFWIAPIILVVTAIIYAYCIVVVRSYMLLDVGARDIWRLPDRQPEQLNMLYVIDEVADLKKAKKETQDVLSDMKIEIMKLQDDAKKKCNIDESNVDNNPSIAGNSNKEDNTSLKVEQDTSATSESSEVSKTSENVLSHQNTSESLLMK